jgi:hypothetical protein
MQQNEEKNDRFYSHFPKSKRGYSDSSSTFPLDIPYLPCRNIAPFPFPATILRRCLDFLSKLMICYLTYEKFFLKGVFGVFIIGKLHWQ